MSSNPITPEMAEAIKQSIINRQRIKTLLSGTTYGLLTGAGLAGVGSLAKSLSAAGARPSTSYTDPVSAQVYIPNEASDGKKRKRSSFDIDSIKKFVTDSAGKAGTGLQGLYEGATSGLKPIDPLTSAARSKDDLSWMLLGGSALAGVPIGFMGGNAVISKFKSMARHNELKAAQREFELAMQELAEAGDRPLKIRKKRASVGLTREEKIELLASNCVELSKTAAMSDWLRKLFYSYVGITPLLFGAYGFQDQWDKRKYKDLAIAERQLNNLREGTNPTFTVANLAELPGSKKKTKSPEELAQHLQEVESSLDAAEDTYRTDYI